MANVDQVEILKRGVDHWNEWRNSHPDTPIDLSHARLGEVTLAGADFHSASLEGVGLRWAYLRGAHFSNARCRKADLRIADLSRADMRGADLTEARMEGAYLREAVLDGANLSGARLVGVNFDRVSMRGTNMTSANLRNAVLVDVNLAGAILNGCRVYGTSVWNAQLDQAEQNDLIITHEKEATITVDSLDVAQFVYLLLNNRKIREVIDTLTSKVVLILGRFTPERKHLLDSLRVALRNTNPGYVPIMFDFDKPIGQDFIETVSTIAHMARFIVADVTDPKVVLEEIPHIVRNIAVPVVPIIIDLQSEPVTLYNLRRNHRSLLPTVRYQGADDLLGSLVERVILPAEDKVRELRSL